MTTFILRRNTDRNPTIAKVAAFLEVLGDRCDWGVTVGPYRRKRSDQQNRMLWGIAYKTLADATGNDPDDLHEFFLGDHFGWEVRTVMGQQRRVPKRRSSGLTTGEFSDYYAFIQRRAAEVGYYVPDPGEIA